MPLIGCFLHFVLFKYAEIVITFWETKEDMDEYYRADNKLLSDFVLKSAHNFESSPVRKDYEITDLYIY